MRKTCLIVALSILILSCSLQSCSDAKADTVNLKFNLAKGRSYIYTINVDSKTEAQGQTASNLIRFEYIMNVADEVNGIKTLKVTYKRIAMKIEMANRKIEVDTNIPFTDSVSEQNPMSMMSAMFAAMKDKSFEMKVDSTGSIVEVNGIRELMTSMIRDMHLPESRTQMLEQMFSAQFNDESIKQNFSQAFNIYPGKTVKVGDKWDKTVNMNMGPMKLESKTNFTVKEINAKTVKLESVSNTSINGSKGTQTGTFEIDRGTGVILNGEAEQEIDGPSKVISHTKITGSEQ
jgi:Family of unknown function (DUF6263)